MRHHAADRGRDGRNGGSRTRAVGVVSRRLAAIAVAVVAPAGWLAAQPGVAPAPAGGTGVVAASLSTRTDRSLESVRARRTALAPPLHLKLQRALPLAARKVTGIATCSALFARLGADGADRLRATLYSMATPEVIEHRCRSGASAATNPGSAVTWLCPEFASLSDWQAAMTLIHEALHFAGLPERPQVAGAMSSTEINRMVRAECGL